MKGRGGNWFLTVDQEVGSSSLPSCTTAISTTSADFLTRSRPAFGADLAQRLTARPVPGRLGPAAAGDGQKTRTNVGKTWTNIGPRVAANSRNAASFIAHPMSMLVLPTIH
jgi:hypothetical protein